MADWRLGLPWTEAELETKLNALRKVGNNFPSSGPLSQDGTDWRRYYSESIIAREAPGRPVPDGAYETAWTAITRYQFSDPGIVTGHFDPRDPLLDRTMVLELKIFGLKYLCGVRVGAVRDTEDDRTTVRAFRYDTLEGHFEVGSEWFTLTKNHDTGEVWFRISASWRPGAFPNWWTRAGFEVFGHRYQLAWHRLSYVRLREIVGAGALNLIEVPHGKNLIHTGPEIVNSDLWVLKKTATERVRHMSKDDSVVTETEIDDDGKV